MVRVETRLLQRNMLYNGEVILKYKIEYPFIYGFEEFNLYNYNKAIKLQKEAETELFNNAKDTYEENKKNGYPLMVFEIVSSYKVTYNNYDFVSLYIDDYIFTGGAHGTTNRTSQTWNINKRSMVMLKDFYIKEPNYVSYIIKEINDQIKQNIDNGNNYYFDDYCCLTSANFRVENFYINNNGKITIYYQQYDIAPYSSGILVFYI